MGSNKLPPEKSYLAGLFARRARMKVSGNTIVGASSVEANSLTGAPIEMYEFPDLDIVEVRSLTKDDVVQWLRSPDPSKLQFTLPPQQELGPSIMFLLDWALPLGKADDYALTLEDIFHREWVPRYGERRARFLCWSKTIGMVLRYQGASIAKFVGGALGLFGLKQLLGR